MVVMQCESCMEWRVQYIREDLSFILVEETAMQERG